MPGFLTMKVLKTLLITVRHPGPAFFIAEALPVLAEKYQIHLLMTDSAIPLLASRYPELFHHPNINAHLPSNPWNPEMPFVRVQPGHLEDLKDAPIQSNSVTQLEPDDYEGIERLIEGMKSFLQLHNIDHVLRTTPASKIGVDEVLATAVRKADLIMPVLCLQEYYGLGLCLEADEHPLFIAGVQAVAVVDKLSQNLLKEQHPKLRSTTVGWIAHSGFIQGPDFVQVRREAREILGLQEDRKLVLYAGICSQTVKDNDLADFQKVVQAIGELNSRFEKDKVLFAYKLHPRTSIAEGQAYAHTVRLHREHLSALNLELLSTYRHFLAVADVIISPTSSMNLDAMAYAATAVSAGRESEFDGPVSLYTIDESSRRAMQAATGLELLPTHRPHQGSFLAEWEDLTDVIHQALFDSSARGKTLQQAVTLYGPDGLAAKRLLAFIQQESEWERR